MRGSITRGVRAIDGVPDAVDGSATQEFVVERVTL